MLQRIGDNWRSLYLWCNQKLIESLKQYDNKHIQKKMRPYKSMLKFLQIIKFSF